MMRLKKYQVKEGAHSFQPAGGIEPPCLKKNVTRIIWKVRIGDLRYTLPHPDNRDINKGGGISFDVLTNHVDAAMWGFRYWNDEGIDSVQFFSYCHVNGGTIKGHSAKPRLRPEDPEVLLEVPHDSKQVVTITLDIHWDRKVYAFLFEDGAGFAQRTETPFTHNKKLGRTIGTWFGGENDETKKPNPAPRPLHLFVGREIIKK